MHDPHLLLNPRHADPTPGVSPQSSVGSIRQLGEKDFAQTTGRYVVSIRYQQPIRVLAEVLAPKARRLNPKRDVPQPLIIGGTLLGSIAIQSLMLVNG